MEELPGIVRCLALNGNGHQCKLDAMYGNLCQVHYKLAETRIDRLRMVTSISPGD